MGRLDNPVPSAADAPLKVGARMRVARQRTGISLTELAKRLHYTKGYLSSVETGSQSASEDIVKLYEEHLGLEPGVLTAQPVLEQVVPRQSDSDLNTGDSVIDVFLSGASNTLSHLSMREAMACNIEIYSPIRRMCAQMGLRFYCAPHLLNPRQELGPQFTNWDEEQALINRSKVLIAYVGEPSFVVGAHLAMARSGKVPILLLCERKKVDQVARLALQTDELLDTLLFESPEDIQLPLAKRLFLFFTKRNLDRAASEKEGKWSLEEYQQKRDLIDRLWLPSKSGATPPVSVEQWDNL